jgi:hypothetical protein
MSASTAGWHPSLRGVVVGAAVGGIGRAVVVALHLAELNVATLPIVLVGAVIGACIGAVAGLVGRIALGAIVGAGLTILVFLVTLPVAFLFQFVGAGTTPSIVATVAIGALSGLAGAAAGRRTPRGRRLANQTR